MKDERVNIESPALGCKLGRAYQILLQKLASELRKNHLDLTTSEYMVMRAVYSSEGLQQCEIADMVGKDKAAVCRCVAGLVKKGLLTTEPVSYKCLKVYLTDKARGIKPKVMEVASSRHNALALLTTPEELEIFSQVLDKILTSK